MVSRRISALVAAAVVSAVGLATWRLSAPPVVGSQGAVAPAPTGATVPADVRTSPLGAPTGDCGPAFVAHDLDHTTVSTNRPSRLFDANGSGVAADDLDGDGRIDVVLGNLDGPDSILWNEGNWVFTRHELDDTSTRSVQLVDVDADGLLDIVTTHRAAGIRYWHNGGDRTFDSQVLPGVTAPAYSMAWADADGDGDLDLATGAYDAELDQRLRSTFLFSDGAGVFLYLNDGGRFTPTRLVKTAQALTTSWIDLDLDGDPELLIGNDFAVHDAVWERADDGTWTPIEPFARTTAHTMSVEMADIDEDGIEEYFATDMKPTSTDTDIIAAWMPLIATMDGLDKPSDVQRIRNVLNVRTADGWAEVGNRAGIDAAGWAWSGRFGDLDADGDLDLHITNGMMAPETFPYLAGSELIEENLVFENVDTGAFLPRSSWGLGSTRSGRGSILADLDDDGRLDVVVNNMDSAAQAFENRNCAPRSVEFVLRQPGTPNTSAIGATVTVTTTESTQVRTVRSGGGYLSGSSVRLHVGLGGADITSVQVRWPDGSVSTLDGITTGTLNEVDRG